MQWVPVVASGILALVSLVFGVLSWAAKRELERMSSEFQELKRKIEELENWKLQSRDTFLTLREFERIEKTRERQEQTRAEEDRRLEANMAHLMGLLSRLRRE